MAKLKEFFASLSPETNPRFWIVVNATCFIYSTALLLIIFTFQDDSKGMEFAEKTYLVYDFTTTLVWCLEAGSSVAFHNNDGTEKSFSSSMVGRILIFLVAIVFLIDSGNVLYEWKFTDEDPDMTAIVVIISCAGYFFMLLDTYRSLHRKKRQGHNAVPDVSENLLIT